MGAQGQTGPERPSDFDTCIAEGVVYLGRIASALAALVERMAAAAPSAPAVAAPSEPVSGDGWRRETPRVGKGDWYRTEGGAYRLRQLPPAALEGPPAYCRDCEARIYWVEADGGHRKPMDLDGRKHWETCQSAPQRDGDATRGRTTAPPARAAAATRRTTAPPARAAANAPRDDDAPGPDDSEVPF